MIPNDPVIEYDDDDDSLPLRRHDFFWTSLGGVSISRCLFTLKLPTIQIVVPASAISSSSFISYFSFFSFSFFFPVELFPQYLRLFSSEDMTD